MTDIEMSSDIIVKLIRHCASDDAVIQAAQTSSKGENKPDTVSERLINVLLSQKHGVPFEHTFFTFYIEVPIFVAREQVKHRISSLNEFSGRYSEMLPKFYTPPKNRGLVNAGKSMRPDIVPGSGMHRVLVETGDREIAELAWELYEERLKMGVAREVARTVLPLSTYTMMYWSVNARSLMNYLSLRVMSDDSLVPSYPQWEINEVARQIEDIFAELMPLTHEAFVKAGRVAP